jgi:Phage capsid family
MRAPAVVPEDLRRNGHRAAVYLELAVFPHAHHAARSDGRNPEGFAKQRWGDRVSEILTRAATSPASMADPDWAGTLATAAVGDFIASLAAISAGARLIAAAPSVSLAGVEQICMPRGLGALQPDQVAWVPELGPIPVLPFVLEAAPVGPPKKLAAIVVASRELIESSSGEQVITQLLRENAAISLDASLFSATAATEARPAGILNGVAPLSGAPAGDDQAVSTDLTALAGAIGSVTAGLAYVAHPQQAHAIRLRRGALWPTDVPEWPTIGVTPGMLIALDPAAFVSGFSATPKISASNESLLQMETAPGANPLAGPTTSLWQTDLVATRLILRAAWAWAIGSISQFAPTALMRSVSSSPSKRRT